MYFNENYIDRILCSLQKYPKLNKNSEQYKLLMNYGCIAA